MAFRFAAYASGTLLERAEAYCFLYTHVANLAAYQRVGIGP
jgi:hypothetical protein